MLNKHNYWQLYEHSLTRGDTTHATRTTHAHSTGLTLFTNSFAMKNFIIRYQD